MGDRGKRPGIIALAALALFVIQGAPAAAQPLSTAFEWTANGFSTAVSCTAAPCAATPLAPRTGTGAFTVYGRVSSGLHVGPQSAIHHGAANGGYVADVQNDYTLNGAISGYAWMAFVWLDADLGPTALPQTILWQEGMDRTGYKAGFTLYVMQGNRIGAVIGRNGSWAYDKALASRHGIGAGAWHHVALVWDGWTLRLLLDGIEEAAVPCDFTPDGSSAVGSWVKLGVGNYYQGGSAANHYVLQGAVDEVKLVQFPIGTYDPNNSFVLREHGLRFRKALLDDMAAVGLIAAGDAEYEVFRDANPKSTGKIRALVNSLFTVESQSWRIPLDPIDTWATGVLNYVYPDAPAIADGNNSFYIRVKTLRSTGYCVAAATILYAAYKAFGYSTRRFDLINDADFNYWDSHMTTDVYMPAVGQYVIQDATYNVSGLTTTGAIDVFDAIGLSRAHTLPALDNDGYVVNTVSHAWTYQTNLFFSYFAGGAVSSTPSWQY